MDQYIGGISHAILHLLYARFWTKVMRDMGMVKFDEPFTRLMTQGMVLNHIYYRRNAKGGIDYIAPDDVEVTHDDAGRVTGTILKADGKPVEYDGVGTMSKSKLNGVDPQHIIDRYGADAARMFVMFASPPEQTMEWSEAGVDGAFRFLKRLWAYAQGRADALARSPTPIDWPHAAPELRTARRELYLQLKQADFDYQRLQYNTVVSAGMKMLNTLEAAPADATSASTEFAREGLSVLLRMLNPVVPHITHALWEELGYAAKLGRHRRCALAESPDARRWRRTRSSSCCRSTASCAASSPSLPAPTRARSRTPRSLRRRCRRRWPRTAVATITPRRGSSSCPTGWSMSCCRRKAVQA